MAELEMQKIEEQIKNAPLSKEDSKKQFVEMTKKLGLQHTFSFDEAWEYVEYKRQQIEFRDKITQFEKAIAKSPDVLKSGLPLKHSFADGQYVRELYNPAGIVLATKIHNQNHVFFLMEGEMSIFSEAGVEHLKAPHQGITKAGTKRIIYTHTPCRFITVHVTDKLDIFEIEDEVIAKSFEEVRLSSPDIGQIDRLIDQLEEK